MNRRILMKCDKCGKEYDIAENTISTRKKKNIPNYCKKCMKEYADNNQRLRWKNLSYEEKKIHLDKLKENNKKWNNSLSKEDRESINAKIGLSNKLKYQSQSNEYKRNRSKQMSINHKNMSEEKKLKMKHNMSKSQQLRWENTTEEQKMISNKKNSDTHKRMYATMTEDERHMLSERGKRTWSLLPEEKRSNFRKGFRNWWDCMSDKDKLEWGLSIKRRWANMSKEDKEEYSEKKRLWWTNLSEEEKEVHREKGRKHWELLSDDEKNYILDSLYEGREMYWTNLSEEDRKKISHRMLSLWNSKSDEEKAESIITLNKGKGSWYKSLSEEEINELNKRRSESMKLFYINNPDKILEKSVKMKEYYNGLSDEDKLSWSIRGFESWNKLSIKDKEERLRNLYIGRDNWFNSLSKEDKQKRSIFMTNIAKQNWENMSVQAYHENCLKHAIEFNNRNILYDAKMAESGFMNILKLHNIDYKFQYYNVLKYDDFDNVFPINAVTGSKFINPYHKWDFLIRTKEKDILVDVDGSIHDPNNGNFIPNGFGFTVRDMIDFNDSQRPYQTDGLDAYVIMAYTDKIDKDTYVMDVKTNKVMTFKEFMSIIFLNTINDNEIKDILKLVE